MLDENTIIKAAMNDDKDIIERFTGKKWISNGQVNNPDPSKDLYFPAAGVVLEYFLHEQIEGETLKVFAKVKVSGDEPFAAKDAMERASFSVEGTRLKSSPIIIELGPGGKNEDLYIVETLELDKTEEQMTHHVTFTTQPDKYPAGAGIGIIKRPEIMKASWICEN
ncbi:hypothetical protein SG34_029040 [Thalassomonas viridans]|uniref:Uncharacterized protein n=1 Tax=Thalassomonas viridans TaxID=137584 RepID=A0AAE9Z4V4_9GAMM|nr:hypothetical protein [Thalassomonas viridans]WDE05288.1 hypothetical protein SG34_029040 [Thalassomonas viridans]